MEFVLGIEFGSTRIKAVLLDESNQVRFSNSYDWENHLENGYWSYSTDEILVGLKTCYKGLKAKYESTIGKKLTSLKAIGVSAMMHGFIALDEYDNFLTPFRTWRNTKQKEASEILSNKFSFHIPERWSIAHLYQTIINKEAYIGQIKKMTTLAGYIHYLLTGNFVLGLNDASGMFPVDVETQNYDKKCVYEFNKILKENGLNYAIEDIMPTPLNAGIIAGRLTKEGISLIDEACELEEGIPFCPPEGDAGTGMIATNSIRERTGNISAGTSIFSMMVLDKKISNWYEEIDVVLTPNGKEVAMVHCNNCTAELDTWVRMFSEAFTLFGINKNNDDLYSCLYKNALNADDDCGGVYSCNYLSGEHITGFESGMPLYVRSSNGKMNLANFFKSLLCSALSTLAIGIEILNKENVEIDKMRGHGGLFKVTEVGPRIVSSALKTPISITSEAGEGGAFGIGVLANYIFYSKKTTLADYLENYIFKNIKETIITATIKDIENYKRYLDNYKRLLIVEKSAINNF